MFNLPVLLAFVAVIVGLRFLRPGMLTWILAWWVGVFLLLKYGFTTPIPASVRMIYMSILTGALLAYVSSEPKRWDGFFGPIVRLVVEPRRRPLLLGLLLLFPALAAINVWAKMNVPLEAPSFGRTVHPAPPDLITVHDTEIDLVAGDNPYRHIEKEDPDAFAEHLENGRRVYFQNCFWCHGDAMAGDGMFAYGLNPIPTNFTDAGILPQFQETFLMWRVAKGGPGMPAEGGPWDSAMPIWENLLTEQEMWDAVMYLFEYTNYRPRAQEVHH